MGFLLTITKKVFFWNYARTTWEWDILCVLILVFIFLTPKSWFEGGERRRMGTHQSPTSTVLVAGEVVEGAEDKGGLQHLIRSLTGHSKVQVLKVRKVFDRDGKTSDYAVDIR